MKTRNEILILTTAFVAMAVIAPYAFADTISQNQSGNGNIQNVGGTVNSPGSNSPHVTATGTAVAGGGSAHSDSHSSSNSTAISASSQKQGQGQGQSQSADNKGNKLNVEQNYAAQKRAPVSTAFSAPLVAAEDTCMGSSSAGGQAVGFGLSVGSTWKDGDCVRRKDARELHNMGQKGAALALLCQSSDVAAAMKTAGTPCPGTSKVGELSPGAGKPVHVSTNTEGVVYEYPTSNRRW
jgi:hypothetical protein